MVGTRLGIEELEVALQTVDLDRSKHLLRQSFRLPTSWTADGCR
jgi:hypothetical protein